MQKQNGWRDYQTRLQRKEFRRRLYWRSLLLGPLLLLLGLGIQLSKVDLSTGHLDGCQNVRGSSSTLRKEDLSGLIDLETLFNSPDGKIGFSYCGRFFSMEPTLDSRLQDYMSKKIQSSRSPLIGFVAMDAKTGRILSMIDSKKMDGPMSVCLSSGFPAASVFKIVSASAAVDGCNISADTRLTFNGRKHTLYRSQLTDRTNRYTNKVSLKNCFAESINPAFGKLGIFRLKGELLHEYAIRFGFNQSIAFELPVEPSRISVGQEPYHWAEVACGFNRETVISPIHGAMMAGAILNDGKLVEPTIVARITDNRKQIVYSSDTKVIRQVISPKASHEMKKLMAATISHGTGSHAFRGYRRDQILSRLSIGGKTGSIKNKSDELLYDWFVGFCSQKAGTKTLAIGVLVVHDKLLRERALEFARLAMRYYFTKPSRQGIS